MIIIRNAKRLLYIICLLTFSAIGTTLKAQTGATSQVGFDIRSGYVVPTHRFLAGDNLQQQKIDQSLSLHLKYAFRFDKASYC